MILLTIRQMEYFEALAETGHFGRAAALVGVSQPALSAQVAEMEQRLGRRLFERGARAARLTEEGRLLAPRIERILADIRGLEQAARRGRQTMEGRLRLGFIPDGRALSAAAAAARTEGAISAHADRAARGRYRDAGRARPSSGRLDAFVAALPIEHPRLVAAELYQDRFFLAVPQADPAFASPPVPPESPELERLMLLEEGHCMRDQALAVCGSVKPLALASYGATSLTTLLANGLARAGHHADP